MRLHDGCPEVPEKIGFQLISAIEEHVHATMESDRAVQPNPTGRGTNIPRVKRRRVAAAHSVTLHLFCGQDYRNWEALSTGKHEVLAADLLHGQDLLDDVFYGYVLSLAQAGKVSALVGGPPRRSFGLWRHFVQGMLPVREREGAGRLGKDGLQPADEALVKREFALLLRFWHLFEVAKEANSLLGQCDPLFLFEHPDDRSSQSGPQVPSVWVFPEWLQFASKHHLYNVTFGPARLATNSLTDFAGLHNLPAVDSTFVGGVWPLALKQCVQRAFNRWQSSWTVPSNSAVRTIHADKQAMWKKHISQDHYPRRRDCYLCQQAIAQSKPHRRCKHPQLGVMSLDLAGPFTPGFDGSRYVLVATFTCPSFGPPPTDLEQPVEDGPCLEDLIGAQDVDIGGGSEIESPEDVGLPGAIATQGGVDVLEAVGKNSDKDKPKTDEGIQAEGSKPEDKSVKAEIEECKQPWHVVTLVLVETVKSKRASETLLGIQRLYSRLRALGFAVERIHTDGGRNFTAQNLKAWAAPRGISVTTTEEADDPKANGRAEQGVRMIKEGMRLLLLQSKLDTVYWPAAARHSAERSLRHKLEYLGVSTPSLPTFGLKASAKKRSWNSRDVFEPRTVPVRVLGPNPDSTMGSLLVVDEDGRIFFVNQLFPALPAEDLSVSGDHGLPGAEFIAEAAVDGKTDAAFEEAVWLPTHRLRGKTGPGRVRVGALRSDEVAETLWVQLPTAAVLTGEKCLDLLGWVHYNQGQLLACEDFPLRCF